MGPSTLSGTCACGNITYTSTAPPLHLDYCYCSVCQQTSGAPFIAWMGIPKFALQWQFKSEPIVYRATIADTAVCVAERKCCGTCGCCMILQYFLYPDKTHVAASTMQQNDFDVPKVGCHIWCRSVPNWHTIPADGIERYQEFDDVFETRLREFMRNSQTSS